MNLNLKYAIEASIFWPPADRIIPGGYKENINEKDLFKLIKQVKDIDGIELYYPYDFQDIGLIKKVLLDEGLRVSAVGVGCFSEKKWQHGSFTSLDSKINREAIDLAKRTVEAASELNSKVVVLWLAHDGYDYYFQTNYQKKWNMIVEALREIALENKQINIGIEYKPKEPRTHQIVSNAEKALRICQETEQSNTGVIMDIGHSFLAGENPSEELVYLLNKGRLTHIHSNDNYSDWDYDMIPASVHFWENIEIFYWLFKLGYDGWINFDICPFRLDTIKSCNLCISSTKKIIEFIKELNVDSFIECEDALSSMQYLWEKLFR
jgi:sugar phosphate isomerase/epimerase